MKQVQGLAKTVSALMPVIFCLFLFSGFCGLLYQVVWIRMAFATFGVITPVLSVVVSVFMLGLALGSWMGGRCIEPIVKRTRLSAIWYYGMAECLIGIGGLAVPLIFSASDRLLLPLGEMDSFRYLFFSALILALSILPWCFFMGTTFPFMMSFMKEMEQSQESSFSYLYLANVIGAMCGTVITACILIELMGFHQTLVVATALQLCHRPGGHASRFFASLSGGHGKGATADPVPAMGGRPQQGETFSLLAILFTTGFVSMAMEVIWTRAFTPVLSTSIYAFASLLAVYLLATWMGTWFYRRQLQENRVRVPANPGLCARRFSFLPVVLNDPRLPLSAAVKILLVLTSIFPFCATLGYSDTQPDRPVRDGQPREAGTAYAVNIIGCILGPIVASYALLPVIGVRLAMILQALLFVSYFLFTIRNCLWSIAQRCFAGFLAAGMLFYSLVFATSYEDGSYNQNHVVRRDYAATVISSGTGRHKQLLVNGIGMTVLIPVTKVMAHLPLALLPRHPESALVICFGMGTTYRSLMSWDIDVTGIELVPGVRDAFGYYFDDAGDILKQPNGRIVIDDGRRYLKRTVNKFDVVTIDPPPPVEAAGSSLLYSRQFYELLKTRLRMMEESSSSGFLEENKGLPLRLPDPCTRFFPGFVSSVPRQAGGYHFLASQQPLSVPTIDEFVERLPERARIDLVEWSDHQGPSSLRKRNSFPGDSLAPHFRWLRHQFDHRRSPL